MPEEEAFCVLIRLMYHYGLRNLYKDGFENLKMKLYQLNRLLEVSTIFKTNLFFPIIFVWFYSLKI